jgi:hypothetical protein
VIFVHPFRKAVEAGDKDAVAALLAENVAFTSPVAFEPLHFDEEGKIDDFMVMVRPLSAAKALAEALGAKTDEIA